VLSAARATSGPASTDLYTHSDRQRPQNKSCRTKSQRQEEEDKGCREQKMVSAFTSKVRDLHIIRIGAASGAPPAACGSQNSHVAEMQNLKTYDTK